MCGILLADRKDGYPAGKSLLKRYHHQKGRGQKGFGFIGLENGYVKEVHRFEREVDFEKALGACKSPTILAHHRMPTSTPNYEDMTHPIFVSNKELAHDYYIIHNGVIRNPDALKKVHEKMGYKYTTELEEINIIKTRTGEKKTSVESFNDSEALAIELARYFDGKSETIEAQGSIAFIAWEVERNGKLVTIHYGHNSGNPIVVEPNNALLFIKSTGDGSSAEENVIFSIDYKTREVTQKKVRIGEYGFDNKKPHQPNMGFGYSDDERDFLLDVPRRERHDTHTGIRSPIQQGEHGLEWGEPRLTDLPVVDISDDAEEAVRYAKDFEEYSKDEQYLDDLLEEIATIEEDIRIVRNNLGKGRVGAQLEPADEEYVAVLEYNLKLKQKKARELEDSIASNS